LKGDVVFQAIEVAPEIKSDPKLGHGVDAATRLLGRMIGDSAQQVRVRWDKLIGDDNRPHLRMKLEDWTGEAEANFTASELTDDRVLRDKFYETYGDLLQIRSHKLLDDLLAGVGGGDSQ
jgi:hypothetical protein